MLVIDLAKETKRIAYAVSGIEDYYLVFAGLIELFVISEKYICSQQGEHGTKTVKEDIRFLVVRIGVDVLHNAIVDVFTKLTAIGLGRQRSQHRIMSAFIVFVDEIFQI